MPYNDIEAIKDILANGSGSDSGDDSGEGGSDVTPTGPQIVFVTHKMGDNGLELTKDFNEPQNILTFTEVQEILAAGNFIILRNPNTYDWTWANYQPLSEVSAIINVAIPSEYKVSFMQSNGTTYDFVGTSADGALVKEFDD